MCLVGAFVMLITVFAFVLVLLLSLFESAEYWIVSMFLFYCLSQFFYLHAVSSTDRASLAARLFHVRTTISLGYCTHHTPECDSRNKDQKCIYCCTFIFYYGFAFGFYKICKIIANC